MTFSKLLVVVLLILLTGCGSNPSRKSQVSELTCLVRTPPALPGQSDKPVIEYDLFSVPATREEWRADPVVIHDPHNKACRRNDPCYIEKFDLYYITPSKTSSDKMDLVRYRGKATPVEIELDYVANKPYLVGRGSNYYLFVLFEGLGDCRVEVGKNDEGYEVNGTFKTCRFFTIETYPDTFPEWEPYRPDKAKWQSRQDCEDHGRFYEPGGGGGHDPP